MMIRALVLAVIVVLLPSPGVAGSTPYVLPVPDGGGDTPSPPSVEGTIARVEKDAIVVEGHKDDSRQQKSTVIRINTDTKMFTVYGGYVGRQELSTGQHVKIWFTIQHPDENQVPIAAVIMLASTKPNDDWP